MRMGAWGVVFIGLVLGGSAQVPDEVLAAARALVPDGQDSLIEGGRDAELLQVAAQWVHDRAGSITRDLHLFEFCSGSGRATAAVMRRGGAAAGFDKATRHPTEDATVLSGVMFAGLLVCRLVVGGLLWCSPQCSTWLGWLSRNYSKRELSNNYMGDETKPKVREGTVTALVMTWLMHLAAVRGAYVLCEQPQNSLIYSFGTVQETLTTIDAHRFVVYLAAYGANSLKPLEIYTTLGSRKMLPLLRTFHEAKARLQTVEKKPLAKKSGKWINGTKDTKKSEEYPFEFADAIAQLVCSLLR